MINRYHKDLVHRNLMSQRIKELPSQRAAFCASFHWSTELPGKMCSSRSRRPISGREIRSGVDQQHGSFQYRAESRARALGAPKIQQWGMRPTNPKFWGL
ncbi:hypothetical protein TNIN_160051 [Trichonephila inaurata madagascariensis]|uniref:Uncharacterized protein n=1 Tax=Trichonephila inaurata madagascariensis TaxID=2747483 RepID=A0A8X7BV73_9ARAC|nr:hypothetical protein TNIN_160051 [Trichonephila inaurata madagascariensis]